MPLKLRLTRKSRAILKHLKGKKFRLQKLKGKKLIFLNKYLRENKPNMSINKITKSMLEFVSKYINESEEVTEESWVEQEEALKKMLKKLLKKKDPNHPKHPLSGYIYFCKENRDDVAAELADVELEEGETHPKKVTSELAKRWNELKDKTVYEEMAKKDKKRYEDAMKDYVPPAENADEKPKKKGRKKKEKKAGPKRAKNAYMFFSNEQRDQVKEAMLKEDPDVKQKHIMKELGRMWREDMDDEAKAPYQALADADKERYQKEKENGVVKEEEVVVEEEKPKPKKRAPRKKKKKVEEEVEEVVVEEEEVVEEEKPKKKKRAPRKKKSSSPKPKPKRGRKKKKKADDEEEE